MNTILVSNYNLYGAKGDPYKFLRRIRHEAGATGLRVFPLNLWGTQAREQGNAKLLPLDMPWEVAYWWHGFATDPPDMNLQAAPMFDLDWENDEWWAYRWELLHHMAEHDLELHEVIVDYCSLKDEWAHRPRKFWHPFNSCVQRWGNVPPRSEEDLLISDGLWTYDEALFGRWVKLADRLRQDAHKVLGPDKYFVESWNELGDLGWGAENKTRTVEWCRRFHERVIALGIPKDHLKISTGTYLKELEPQVGKVCFHGVCRPTDVALDYGIPVEKVEISMDGGVDGDGPANFMDGKMASKEQIVGIVRRMKEFGYTTLEGFDFNMERDSYSDFCRSDMDKFDPTIFRAAAEELLEKQPYYVCSISGKSIGGWCGIVHMEFFIPGTEPLETCDVCNEPEPKPDTRTCWEKHIAGRPVGKWNIRGLIKCWFGLIKCWLEVEK